MTEGAPGLYIHIPFCRSKCHYCSFYSVSATDLIPAFLRALEQEMDLYRQEFTTFDTIYLGGGTPSLLGLAELDALLTAVAKKFHIAASAEITLEANPADLDRQSLAGLRRLGVNRLNIGIQSLDDKLLAFLGRRHGRREALEAMEAARAGGFDNLCLDLIYGIPGQEQSSWQDTLDLALAFAPAHLSCYQLTLEPGTPLLQKLEKLQLVLPDEERRADFYFQTADTIRAAGYHHYEVSNFAREETASSRHNQKYWRHVPYLGLGPAAHSFLANKRWWNRADLTSYLCDCDAGIPPVSATEALTVDKLLLEALFLGLRTSRGIDLTLIYQRYGYDLLREKATVINHFLAGGLLEVSGDYLRPTPAGMAVADTLALM